MLSKVGPVRPRPKVESNDLVRAARTARAGRVGGRWGLRVVPVEVEVLDPKGPHLPSMIVWGEEPWAKD